jgi:hypothetical protein
MSALARTPAPAATPGPIEKRKLVAAIPVDAASFLPIYLAAAAPGRAKASTSS